MSKNNIKFKLNDNQINLNSNNEKNEFIKINSESSNSKINNYIDKKIKNNNFKNNVYEKINKMSQNKTVEINRKISILESI